MNEFDEFEYAKGEIVANGAVCLYMYVSQEQLNAILESGALKLSRTSMTNDVTENILKNEYSISSNIQEYGYLCFSATCKSPMMWGQYADRGKGACLVFCVFLYQHSQSDDYDVYKICLNSKEKLTWNTHGFTLLRKIKYTNDRYSGSNFLYTMSTKSKDWEHEKEYRIIISLSDISRFDCVEDTGKGFSYKYLYRGLMGGLRRVILGVNNSSNRVDLERRLNTIFQRSKENSIRVLRSSINPEQFMIDIHQPTTLPSLPLNEPVV